MLPASAIKQQALELGFDLVGIAPPAALKDLELLPQWIQKGFGGEMRYLADPRREDPRRALPSVKSIICVGLVYNAPHPYSTEVDDPTEGKGGPSSHGAPTGEMHSRAWISRYAWGNDYHDVMRSKLEQLRTAVEKLKPDVETRVYVDTGPLLERAFARLSGIGWMGKNTCLINEQMGSWFYLGVILTNLELALDLPAPDRCGSCTRCLQACPTGALVEPYVMDASRCIAYFNIELKGAIPEEFRSAIGRNVFGCDICQDVCPWNNRPLSVVSGRLPGDAASVVSQLIFDNAVFHGTPSPPAPLPQGGEGEVDSLARAFLGERVARRGVLISRGETGAPRSACRGGEGVLPIVNSKTGHHTSVGHLSAGSPPRRAATTDLPEFQPMQVEIKPPLSPSAAGPEPNSPLGPTESFSLFHPSLEALASLTEEDFRKLFARSPIKRAKYRGWLRNLCVAMGNSRNRRFVAWLEDVAQHSDPMVREHAQWALRQLQTAE
jgi:epoxyqueuosine reductase